MKANPIFLLTDFGMQDPYAGQMKGVILSVNTSIPVVDLTHSIPPQDLDSAARVLRQSLIHSPANSVFVVVVDPGVGTRRRILCAHIGRRWVLAPDNGVLGPVLEDWPKSQVREVCWQKMGIEKGGISDTFHGRDVFAPVAAKLAANRLTFRHMGPIAQKFKKLRLRDAARSGEAVVGTIRGFDHFGNALTNIPRCLYPDSAWTKATVSIGRKSLGRIMRCYEDKSSGLMPLWSSSGYLELAVPGGSARHFGKLRMGMKIQVRRKDG